MPSSYRKKPVLLDFGSLAMAFSQKSVTKILKKVFLVSKSLNKLSEFRAVA